jgi:iron complex outermembrane recepter protein
VGTPVISIVDDEWFRVATLDRLPFVGCRVLALAFVQQLLDRGQPLPLGVQVELLAHGQRLPIIFITAFLTPCRRGPYQRCADKRPMAGIRAADKAGAMGTSGSNARRDRLLVLWVCMVALAAVPAAAADVGADPQTPAERSAAAPSEPSEQVVITGTRLSTAPAAQDVRIYDRPRIEQSGRSTVTDFLVTLPEVSLNSSESTNGATTARLRGALAGSALILIDGRRTQAVTGGAALVSFFDLNTIPLSLVERVEVQPNGSSAIYGGDALAGVVNIVLRSDFTGFEAEAGYKWADDTDEKIFSVAAGWQANALSISVVGTYSDRSPLYGRDREITASPDYRPFGGPNLGTQFFGVPATVSSVSGNLPGLNASLAAVPVGSTGTGLMPSDFAATAGMQHAGSTTYYQALITKSPRYGVFASANYRFSEAFELFAEVLASQYTLDGQTSPPFLQFALVPPTNAFSPWRSSGSDPGTPVRVSGVVQGAEELATFTFDESFLRPVIGARGNFRAWDWELSALHSRDEGAVRIFGQPDVALQNAALASSDPATALNPFVDGPMGSPALLGSIYSSTIVTDYQSEATIIDAFARRPLFDLPGGPVNAVVGAEYEASALTRDFDARRNAWSLFGELRAPIIAGGDESTGKREVLALNTAARYDNFSDFGSQTTWQAGFEFRPVDGVLLRGMQATAFKPPTLYNIGAPRTPSPIPVNDPQRGGETLIITQIIGGNPSLSPITGRTTTVGGVWSPPRVPSLNLSMTYWQMRIDNAINLPSPQYIVDNETLYPGRVVRAPAAPGEAGQILSVDRTFINFGTTHEKGIDASIDWRFSTGFGDFTPSIAATYIMEFEGASVPGGPVVNRLSRAQLDGIFAPRWKGIASIAWDPNPTFRLWFAGRYIGSYLDYTPTRSIGDVWYIDATLEIDLVRALQMSRRSLDGIRLVVSATNLADELPPYSTYFRGYDVYNYDLVGRTIFLRLQLQA